MHIIIASTNSEKAHLLKQLLSMAIREDQDRVSTLFDKTIHKEYALIEKLMETLSSYTAETPLELAKKKAIETARTLNTYAIAEETLLTLPFLMNEDKAFQEKKAYQNASFSEEKPLFSFQKAHEKLKKSSESVLSRLKKYEDPLERMASLCSFFAYANHNGNHVETVVSRMEGYISDQEIGRRTFEYGSLFIKHEYAKTLSELPESIFLRITHRKKGIDRLYQLIRQHSLLT